MGDDASTCELRPTPEKVQAWIDEERERDDSIVYLSVLEGARRQNVASFWFATSMLDDPAVVCD